MFKIYISNWRKRTFLSFLCSRIKIWAIHEKENKIKKIYRAEPCSRNLETTLKWRLKLKVIYRDTQNKIYEILAEYKTKTQVYLKIEKRWCWLAWYWREGGSSARRRGRRKAGGWRIRGERGSRRSNSSGWLQTFLDLQQGLVLFLFRGECKYFGRVKRQFRKLYSHEGSYVANLLGSLREHHNNRPPPSVFISHTHSHPTAVRPVTFIEFM